MKKRIGLPATLIGTIAVAGTFSGSALAQSESDDELEVITVIGIRSSLEHALDIKRQATNVVDSVVAEDIGKLPDQNVAEALQRVPGVSISRERGEGRNISVRGMDGSFNVTTVNGRRLATENPGREFSYDVLASELVSRIDVHKTPQAGHYEGGIGAVVDIRTLRPFDLNGRLIHASAFAVQDSLADDTNPRASLVIGNQSDDERFGYLFSLNYNKRSLREDSATINEYRDPFDIDLFKDGTVDYASTVLPRNIQFRTTDEERERLGGTFALQFRPSDTVEVTWDGLYSEFNVDSYTSNLGIPLDVGQAGAQGEYWEHPAYVAAEVDSNNNVVYARFGDDGTGTLRNPWAWVETVAITEPRKTKTYLTGLNVDWQAGESLSFNSDVYYTKARRQNDGDNWLLSNRTAVNWAEFDWRDGGLLPDIRFSEEPGSQFINTIAWNNNTGTDVTDEIWEAKLDGVWQTDGDSISEVRFGVSYSNQEKSNDFFATTYNDAYFGGNLAGVWYPDSDPRIGSIGDYHRSWMVPDSVYGPALATNFLSDVGGQFPRGWPALNVQDVLAFYEDLSPEAFALFDGAFWPSRSYDIQEAAFSVYGELDFVGELGGMGFALNAGLRVAHTEQESRGFDANIDHLVGRWGGVPVWAVYEENAGQRTVSKSYTEVLPSMNFKLDISDNVVGRFSAARVMSRAPINDLRVAERIFPEPWNGFVERGNPNLDPFIATQLDATFEWYYSDDGALLLGAFYKDVDSFIAQGPDGTELSTHPFMCVNPNSTANSPWECVDDPAFALDLEVRRPFSVDGGGKIKGIEFAWQQSLDQVLPESLEGFGYQVNLTYADSESELTDINGEKLPFLGMAEIAYNVTGYFERGPFGIRLAYNYRDSYLSELANRNRQLATYVRPYGQLDFSAYWDVSDTVSVRLYGSNLTDERYETTIGDGPDRKIRFAGYTGEQIAVGVSVKFQ